MQPNSRKGSCEQISLCRGSRGYFGLFRLQAFSLTAPLLAVEPAQLFFFHTPSNSSHLALAACKTGAQTEQKQEVRGRTFFTCQTNRPGVPGGHGKPERLFFQRGPTHIHLLPSGAEAGCECMPAPLTSSESRDVGQAQRGSHYSPVGVSCDLKGH